jgi:hypothetical protein
MNIAATVANGLLDPARLFAQAQAETGLTELDGPDVHEPLERLTHALRTEAALTSAGVQSWHARLLGILSTRLRACDWFRREPGILAERLPPAVVILGLGRTGSTLLQRLLAADPRFYSAAWWECRFPVPAPDDVPGARRIAAAQAEVAAILASNPDLAAIHPWDALGADEEILLLDQTLTSTTAESMAHVPSYRRWLREQDLRPAYRYLLQMLQFLQWQKRQRGVTAQRWVLKTPMHLGYVDVLMELWPQTRFVQTHRDPIATIPSFASMVRNLWKAGSDADQAQEAGRQWCETLAMHIEHCMAVRERAPEGTFVDVDYRDTVARPLEVVSRVEAAIGLSLTDAARARVAAYIEAHPRDARPPHRYGLEEFGFSRADLAARFRRYRERHILPFGSAEASDE